MIVCGILVLIFITPYFRIHKFQCPLCNFVHKKRDVSEEHVVREHPNWKAALVGKFDLFLTDSNSIKNQVHSRGRTPL